MAIEVTLTEARRRFSELLDRAEAGDDVVIMRRGHPPMEVVRRQQARNPLPDITQEVENIDAPGKTTLETLLDEREDARF